MSKRFAVVSEAPADFEQATELADRVLIDSIDWLEDWLDANREWVGVDADGGSLSWRSIAHLARDFGIRVHGHFGGVRGEPDAKAAWRELTYIRARMENVHAILLIRDMDDQPERRQGLEQARNEHAEHVVVVVGCANPKRECWVLSGFDAEDEYEQERFEAERQNLGFDPCVQSHLLSATNEQAKTSAKRVFATLSEGVREREQRCWQRTALAVLIARGEQNGLAEYLREVRERLVPLIAVVDPAP